MARRQEPRVRMVAPVRLFGTDANGRPFNTQVDTVDVSPSGIHAAGLTVELKPGDLIGVQYQQQRARYRVQWVGELGTYREGHAGLRGSEASRISGETSSRRDIAIPIAPSQWRRPLPEWCAASRRTLRGFAPQRRFRPTCPLPWKRRPAICGEIGRASCRERVWTVV